MTATEPTPLGVDAPVDAAFLDLVSKLGPVFAEVAKAAVAEAIAAVPTPTLRPGVVQGVTSSTRSASVLLDGDTTAIVAQVLGELPYPNARVMVEFVPPGAVFVIGIIGGCGVPPGAEIDYSGPITEHADAATAQPTSNQPPPGWLWCAGQAVSRATYSALFAAIGTAHGAGDGATTFNVPDKRGRLSIPLDNMGGTDAGRLSMANTLGGTGGSNTIAQGNLPNVNFTVSGGTVSGTVTISDPTHNHSQSNLVSSTQGVAAGIDYTGDVNTTSINTGSSSTGITASFSSGSFSGGTAASGGSGTESLPPYALCHRIIKT